MEKGKKMQVNLIFEERDAPLAEIHAKEMNDEITRAVEFLSGKVGMGAEASARTTVGSVGVATGSGGDGVTRGRLISGWNGDFITLLKPENIMRIYSGSKKVFAETENETYELKLRLYEVEALLGEVQFKSFVRVSNTDIVNFDFVKNLDLSLSGTICVNFNNKTRTFVSRRYIPKVMEWLNVR